MKIITLTFVLLTFLSAWAWADCSDFSTQGTVALSAVKSIVTSSSAAPVSFEVQPTSASGENAHVLILPRFANFKDLYDVKLRKSDCKILIVTLAGEGFPLN